MEHYRAELSALCMTDAGSAAESAFGPVNVMRSVAAGARARAMARGRPRAVGALKFARARSGARGGAGGGG